MTNVELIQGIGDIVGIMLTVSLIGLNTIPAGWALNTWVVALKSTVTTFDMMEMKGNYAFMAFTMMGLKGQSWCGRIGINYK